MNKKIIDAVCKMDIDSLNVILSNKISYQDTSKSIFLKRLNLIFNELKETDDKLVSYEGGCCAKHEDCENSGKWGVAFLGEKSKKHFSLIIENNEDGSIKDIFTCHSFGVKNQTVQQEIENFYEIEYLTIYNDEKNSSNGFKGDLYSSCTSANVEWVQYRDGIIPKNEIIRWVRKYNGLRKALTISDMSYRSQDLFCTMYLKLFTVYTLMKYEKKAAESLKKMQKINFDNELEILDWLKENDQLYSYIMIESKIIFRTEDIPETKQINREFNIHFETKHIQNCIELEKVYNQYSYLKEKYNINDGDLFVEVLGGVLDRKHNLNAQINN